MLRGDIPTSAIIRCGKCCFVSVNCSIGRSAFLKETDLKQETQHLDRMLLASAAHLASSETVEQLFQTLCHLLLDATSEIRLCQVYQCQTDGAQQVQLLCTRATAAPDTHDTIGNAVLAAHRAQILSAALSNQPVVFRPQHGQQLNEEQWDGAPALQAAAAIPFSAPESNDKIVALLGVDNSDFFDDEALRPFVSFAGLCSALLNQAFQRQQLSDFATFDHLTGLLNRRALAEILEREHVRAERYNRRYSVLFFDLDHFKRINDSYGHSVGDQALQAVAKIACRVLREGDWIGRWGGEEFLCVLPDACDGEAERIAHRLRTQVTDRPIIIEQHSITLSLSIGVACFPQDGYDINTLLVHADAGLAAAKHDGRNCVKRYQPGM